MHSVGIFYPDDGWILNRCGRELAARLGIDPHVPGDINYYINYPLMLSIHHPGTRVALFTHLEETGVHRKTFFDAAKEADHCVAMSHTTVSELLGMNVPICRITKIHMGVPQVPRLKFGVVGRSYPSGRKGETLIERMIASGHTVLSFGPEGRMLPGEPIVDLGDFYREIDYLVVTSSNEGGPVPVLDALAHSVPVIAPDTGWCWEYSVLRYEKGDWHSLKRVLDGLRPPTWQDWADGHEELFRRLGARIP